MKKVLLVLSTQLFLACGGVGQSAALKGSVDLSDFLRVETVGGDKIITVLAHDDFKGTTLTVTNPAKGVGSQNWSNANELCSRLKYGNETGFNLVSQETLQYLSEKKILSLIEDLSGTVWYSISNSDRLRLAKWVETRAKAMDSGQGLFFLAKYGYEGWDSLESEIHELQQEVENQHGDSVWGPGLCSLPTNNFNGNLEFYQLYQLFEVICEKKTNSIK